MINTGTKFVIFLLSLQYDGLQTIEEFKKGKVEFRADKTGIVHLPFGKASFSEEDLTINLLAAVVYLHSYPSEKKKLTYVEMNIFWHDLFVCVNFDRNQWKQTSQLEQKVYTGKVHIYVHQWGLQFG